MGKGKEIAHAVLCQHSSSERRQLPVHALGFITAMPKLLVPTSNRLIAVCPLVRLSL